MTCRLKEEIPGFAVHISSELRPYLEDLNANLEPEYMHQLLWTMMTKPSHEFHKQHLCDPHNLYVIACSFTDSNGSIRNADQVTQAFSKMQWMLRVCAIQQVQLRKHDYISDVEQVFR